MLPPNQGDRIPIIHSQLLANILQIEEKYLKMSLISAKHGFALVTPASRGLGFAFAQQLLAQTQLPVVATARKNCAEVRDQLLSSKGLPPDAEDRLRVLKVDVTGRYPLQAGLWVCLTDR